MQFVGLVYKLTNTNLESMNYNRKCIVHCKTMSISYTI